MTKDTYTQAEVAKLISEAEARGMERAASKMNEWAEEADGNIDTGHPSGMNVSREVERDLCREAAENFRTEAAAIRRAAEDTGT